MLKRKYNNNIAQTGLRILFVAQLLIKGPLPKAKIIEEIAKNPYLKNVTPDTITLDINTLKSVGFEIATGNKSNNYCYELKLVPVKIKFTKTELRALLNTKSAMFHFMDFRCIISLYEAFEKISKLLESDEQIQSILDFGNILKTDFKLLKELDVHAKHKNELLLVYDSPTGKKRRMSVICDRIEYSKKNDKLYLWGECSEYGTVYLRTDKIKKIVKIVKVNAKLKIPSKSCVYSILNKKDLPVNFEGGEKIVKYTSKYIQITEVYTNEFNLIQKLLSYGENLADVEDENIRAKLLETIKNVKEMYI